MSQITRLSSLKKVAIYMRNCYQYGTEIEYYNIELEKFAYSLGIKIRLVDSKHHYREDNNPYYGGGGYNYTVYTYEIRRGRASEKFKIDVNHWA